MKKIFILLVLFAFSNIAFSQNNRENTSITIKKASGEMTLDGNLDEQAWSEAETGSNFFQTFPTDTLAATSQTEIKFTFDDEFIYVGAVCYDNNDEHIVASLKRDFEFITTEALHVYFDTYNDLTNGFVFGSSPYGVQAEGVLSERERVSRDWDNKWFVEVKNYKDKWIVEMAIPFKTLRYKAGGKVWNVNFIRNDLKNNERTTWMRIPRQFRGSNILYSAKMIWDTPPPKQGANISLIPYVSSGILKNQEEGTAVDHKLNAGFDAKIGITSSLNLDLTVNPDFSQVEVDEQVTNLDRFEISFPEKRQFFLENSDLFANGGFPFTRPFFSRRIGIATDTAGNNTQIPIIYGAKLSGKVGKDWRIGFMNVLTDKNEKLGILGQNYTVATVQKRLFSTSNLQAFFVNRHALKYDKNDTISVGSEFNQVLGLEYNFSSKSNKWIGEVYYYKSLDPDESDRNTSSGAFLGYNAKHLAVRLGQTFVDENFNAEVGFVPRTNRLGGFFRVQGAIFPKTEAITGIKPGLTYRYTYDRNFTFLDNSLDFEIETKFQNTSELEVSVQKNIVTLTRSFDPSRSDGLELAEDTRHEWTSFEVGYVSNLRRQLGFGIESSYGGFFNGNRFSIGGGVIYRRQPYANISIQFDYNEIELPAPYSDNNFWLIGPKIDLTFTDKLFFTTFIQYNEQADNLNINARFQWRFKPVSDLFIVYTDNYVPNGLNVKNRALVMKLSYWFNI